VRDQERTCRSHTIGAALKACYDEPHAPKLPDFLALCRRFAKRSFQHQDVSAIPTAQAAAIIAEAQKRAGIKKEEKYDYKLWAKKLIARHEAGGNLSPGQIQMAQAALGVASESL